MVRRALALLALSFSLIPSAVAQVNVTSMYRSLTADWVDSVTPYPLAFGANSPSTSLAPSFSDSLSFPGNSGSSSMDARFATFGNVFEFLGGANFSLTIDCGLTCHADDMNIRSEFLAVFTLDSAYSFNLNFLEGGLSSGGFAEQASFVLRSGGNIIVADDFFGVAHIAGGTELLSHSLFGPNLTGTLGPGSYSLAYLSEYGVTSHQQGFNFGEFHAAVSMDFRPVVTPIPEPETYALLLAGLAFLGWTTRRGRPSRA